MAQLKMLSIPHVTAPTTQAPRACSHITARPPTPRRLAELFTRHRLPSHAMVAHRAAAADARGGTRTDNEAERSQGFGSIIQTQTPNPAVVLGAVDLGLSSVLRSLSNSSTVQVRSPK